MNDKVENNMKSNKILKKHKMNACLKNNRDKNYNLKE